MSGRPRRISLGWKILLAVILVIAVVDFFSQTLVPK
jgi:hypothetical protein